MDKQENFFEFITEYEFRNKKYSDSIFAKNYEEATEKLKSKKETEIILGYDPTEIVEA